MIYILFLLVVSVCIYFSMKHAHELDADDEEEI